ncbi:protein KAKU4-like isoform X2 [Tripterygium wilfordii]|uniref:protein KAKU4-like isoform X2 n=1 Tax=Tripterygium wilfordii TaxID=458696 RepID=UPI0018F84C5C|nr:protein KAKU4-like isoform X2 [Tripterygium wilfordii]
MGSASRPRPGAGGKMVRLRRRAAPITPYHRPRLLPYSQERNPSWISRIILSPTRLIATGAGKVLSTVFGPDPESSSSSSSSSSATDSTSEDDVDDAKHDDDLSSLGADRMNKNWKSQLIESFQGKPQPVEWKSENKRVIEQLVMQETFSREECDRLTHIINSRVIDSPGVANTQEEIENRTVDSAIMEAQKWLEEKKSGSTSMLELDPGTTAVKSALLPQVIGSEVGSPVDMAKSYMQSRPPWASQSSNHFKSPLPLAVQLFKEETSYSVGGNSVSLSKVSHLKRDSSASGSWNILEEIRRVRSKATEMRTPPSSKNDWSGFTSDYKTTPTALFADNLEGGMREKMHDSSKSGDGLSLDTRVNTPEGFLGAEDIKVVSHSDNGNAVVDGLKDTNGTGQLSSLVVGEAIQDLRLHEGNGSLLKEATRASDAFASNGCPSFISSPCAGLDKEENPVPFNEEQISVDPGYDKEIEGASVKETCEILSEASVEVVVVNENDSVVPDSQNSSSLHNDEWLENLVQPNPKPSSVGRKLSRYDRRGRGQGK